MREILFRGKMKTDNGEYKKGDWVYGDFVTLIDGKEPHPHIYGKGEVKSDTVGQFTELKDKNGKKIFEGDIIRVDDTENAVVEYDETSAFYMVVFDRAESDFGSLIEQYPNVEIIGNIHDNPELLKEKEKCLTQN